MKFLKSVDQRVSVLLTILAAIAVMQGLKNAHWLPNEFYFFQPSSSSLSVIVQDHLKDHSDSLADVVSPRSQRAIPLTATTDLPSEEELANFPGATVVESAEVDGPEPNQSTRIKILKTDFKYPLVRSEEVIDNQTGAVLDREEMAADHLLVSLPPGADPAAFLRSVGPEATSISQLASNEPLYMLNLAAPSISSLPQILGALASNGDTRVIVEPDIIHHAIDNPDNFVCSRDWGLLKVAGELNQFTAPSKQYGTPSKLVAIIDTGIRYTHHELSPNMWHNPSPTAEDIYGWNAVENNGNPNDDNGHGTFCAGEIGAVGNNNVGMAGVVPVVQLMACKAFDKNGNGLVSDEVTCIKYACDHGAKVLNCSWGGGASKMLYNALGNAQKAGVICVAAAGNSGLKDDFFYPAAYGMKTSEGAKLDNVVSVAASTPLDTLASFSNYGTEEIPLAAPGVDICSTFDKGDDSYAIASGTSMAAPYVSGALVLLETQFPNESCEAYVNRLYNTADKVSALTGKVTFGRLNITKALTQ